MQIYFKYYTVLNNPDNSDPVTKEECTLCVTLNGRRRTGMIWWDPEASVGAGTVVNWPAIAPSTDALAPATADETFGPRKLPEPSSSPGAPTISWGSFYNSRINFSKAI